MNSITKKNIYNNRWNPSQTKNVRGVTVDETTTYETDRTPLKHTKGNNAARQHHDDDNTVIKPPWKHTGLTNLLTD